jgi:hypothetical protein
MDNLNQKFKVHSFEEGANRNYQEPPLKDFSYTKVPPPRKSGNNYRPLIIAIIAIIIIGIGSLWLGSSSKDKAHASPTKPVAAVKKQTQNLSSAPSGNLTTYSSNNFNLGVTYPSNWVISDTPATMSITSPITKIVNEYNKVVEGKIIINVNPQGQLPTQFGSSPATAVLNSQLISYSAPTPAQDAQTYLSFAQYSSSNIIGSLNGIYVTGNFGYLKGQSIPQSDIQSVSPLVSVSFEQCSNLKCSSLSNLTISATDWSSSSFANPIIAIIKSFQFS